MAIYTTQIAEDTKAVAQEFAQRLKGGELIALIGDLGAGKTTFTQGLAAALGATVRVKSPTFAVMHEYPVAHGDIRRLVHLDMYRFTHAEELRALALEDELRADTVVVVEWPNILPDVDWVPAYTVTIRHTGGNSREIEIVEHLR